MIITSLKLHEFVANEEAMKAVAGFVINPTVYHEKNIKDIIEDFNNIFVSAKIAYQIEPANGAVYYLRYEAERLDRALYILSCLTPVEVN